MSDPNFRDPRLDPPPLREDDIRGQRLSELDSSNAMWGWIAGAVVLALVLVFVFAGGQSTTNTASNVPLPPATTGSAPPRDMNPPAANTQVPRPQPQPSTTGQGGQGGAAR
jgi:hypothetical protein